MRDFENLDAKFFGYVLKKYKRILFLAGLVIVIAVVALHFVTPKEVKPTVVAPHYLYNVIHIQAADTLYGEEEIFYSESDSEEDKTVARVLDVNDEYISRKLQNKSAALASLNLPAFMQKCRAIFIEKTGHNLPPTLRVCHSLQGNWIISTVDLGGKENKEDNYNDALVLAEIVVEEALKCLNEQKSVKKAERIGETTESGILLTTKINGKNADIMTIEKELQLEETSSKVLLKLILCAFFAFAAVVALCSTIEFLRDPVVSCDDVQRSTGVEVFKNLNKALYQAAAGRKMREILAGRKILTLAGEINGKAIDQVISALHMENNSVCTVLVTNKISSNAVENYFQNPGQVCDIITEDRLEINSNLAAAELSSFYDLQKKLSVQYDVVLIVLDALQNMPKLLPQKDSCVIMCAIIGDSKNFEIVEVVGAIKLGGAEISGAIVV